MCLFNIKRASAEAGPCQRGIAVVIAGITSDQSIREPGVLMADKTAGREEGGRKAVSERSTLYLEKFTQKDDLR